MKTIIKSCALALSVGALATSCSDFINIIPKDLVTEANFWDEKNDVDQMVTGIYYKMQADGMMRRYMVWGELRSDNIYMGSEISSKDGNSYEVLRENILSTNGYTRWTDFYNIINACNQIIEKAPQVAEKDPTYTVSNLNATIAEVTALRSLMYFYLIRTFRDVPFYRHAVQSEDLVVELEPSSFDDVLDAIISDCEATLPYALKAYTAKSTSTYYNINTGRITQNAIHAMLADMYLWKGDYAKVIEHADAVIADFCNKATGGNNSGSVVSVGGTTVVVGSSNSVSMVYHNDDEGVTYNVDGVEKTYRGYPLYLDGSTNSSYFGNAFSTIFGHYGGSKETIFELAFSPQVGSTYQSNTAVGFFYGNGKDGNRDNAKGVWAPNRRIYENNANAFYDEADSRRYEVMELTDKDGSEAYIRKYVSEGASIDKNKSLSEGKVVGSYPLQMTEDYDWIFYRLTDVMTMKAEALVEQMLDEPQNEEEELNNNKLRMQAFYMIYAINKRSCMDDAKALKAADYENKRLMQTLVQTERRKELMFEGKRWFDLVRYAMRKGNVSELSAAVKPKFDNGTGGNVLPNMESLFWPYSKEEVRINTKLDQKSYWAGLESAETTESTAKK